MCDSCKSVYRSNEKHDESVCPIANSLMCSCCKSRGHATLKCPKTANWQTRIPEYIEQLIPFDLRIHHRILSDQMTPLNYANPGLIPCHHILKWIAKSVESDSSKTEKEAACAICQPVIEIPEDKGSTAYTANIRATLASNNLPSTSVKENKKLLEKFAAINGKKVIYLKKDRYIPTEPPVTKPPNKKQGFKVKVVSSEVTNS